MEFIIKSLEWIYNQAPMYKKINVKIPMCYEHIKKLALKIGFSNEGIDRQSFIKNKRVIDQWSMGITRAEIKELLL